MSTIERRDTALLVNPRTEASPRMPQAFLAALLTPGSPSAGAPRQPEAKPKRQSLDKEVRRLLEASGEGIKAPPIQVEVALIQHGTEQDAAALARSVHDSDIVVPELAGARPETLAMLQDLADGKVTPEEVAEENPFFTEFFLAFCVAVYKSGVRIAHVDAKQGDAFMGETHEAFEKAGSLMGPVIRQEVPFEQACTNMADSMVPIADVILRRRNELMLDNLAPAIANVVRANPSLQYPHRNRKKPLKVFMYLGALHDDVPKQLKKSGTKVKVNTHKAGERKFGNHTSEIMHRSAEGKPVGAAEGKLLLLEFIFERLYGFVEPHLGDDDPFAPLMKLGVLELPQRIFADVFLADAEEIYTNCPPELSSSLRNQPSVRQVILDYYNSLIKKRRSQIVRKVNGYVRQIKRAPQTS